jgi:hypothetical protein
VVPSHVGAPVVQLDPSLEHPVPWGVEKLHEYTKELHTSVDRPAPIGRDSHVSARPSGDDNVVLDTTEAILGEEKDVLAALVDHFEGLSASHSGKGSHSNERKSEGH